MSEAGVDLRAGLVAGRDADSRDARRAAAWTRSELSRKAPRETDIPRAASAPATVLAGWLRLPGSMTPGRTGGCAPRQQRLI
jgi:hypothetical protein